MFFLDRWLYENMEGGSCIFATSCGTTFRKVNHYCQLGTPSCPEWLTFLPDLAVDVFRKAMPNVISRFIFSSFILLGIKKVVTLQRKW